jgi:hypothetical protein
MWPLILTVSSGKYCSKNYNCVILTKIIYKIHLESV